MNTREKTDWRSYFVAVNGIAINLALLYSLLVSNVGKQPAANFEFPQSFSFEKITARQVDSNRQKNTQSENKINAVREYQFFLNDRQINLEISYLIDTRGDVETYLKDRTDLAKEIIKAKKIKQQPDIGYHFLLADDRRAYLSSCISPRSLSNVTQKQFSQYRYQNDLNLKTGWDWLQGKASIRDRRCLWILLSTPIETSPQAAYQTLEAAWSDLYRWWLPNFPSLTGVGYRPNSANS